MDVNPQTVLLTLTLSCCTTLQAGMSDWIPDLLSHNACHGYYQYDPLTKTEPPTNFKEPVHLQAKSISIHQDGLVEMHGDVEVIQGQHHLHATEASLFREHETHRVTELEAVGNVILIQPGLRLQGEHLWLDYDHQQVKMGPNEFRWYPRHARGTSQALTLTENGHLNLSNATYTTCAPEQDSWLLKASRLRLNPTQGKGHAYSTQLLIKKTPIFYLPYLQFPLDNRRQSGFLYPSFGTKEDNGWIIAQPYYLNIAPNYDALLTPRLRTERGVELQALFRYLTTSSTGSIETSFLPQDRAFAKFKQGALANPQGLSPNDPRLRALNVADHRFGLVIHHSEQLTKHWSFAANFNHVHDANHVQDLDDNLHLNDRTYLLQQGILTYQDATWNSQLLIQSFETLNPFIGPLNENIYQRLPMVSLTTTQPWTLKTLELQPSFDWANFHFPGKKLDGTQATIGHRNHFKQSLRWPWHHPGAFFVPEFSLDLTKYDLTPGTLATQLNYPAHIQRAIPIYSLDSGLIFERRFKMQETPWLQTLEPRLFYLYVPYRDQNDIPLFDSGQTTFVMDQLLRPNRFNGVDRIGDTHQLSTLLTARWLDGTHWQERLRTTIGEIYYFKTRRVTLCDHRAFPECLALEDPRFEAKRSPLLLEMRYQLDNAWTIQGNIEWYSTTLDSAGLRFAYRDPQGMVVNLGYSHIINPLPVLPSPNLTMARPGTLEQTEFSMAWPWRDQWQVIGRWHYDWRKHTSLATIAGIEYSGCCVSLQLMVSREAQLTSLGRPQHYAHSITFQFGLKGLGGLGHNLSKRLQEQITGYRPLVP